jgi:hypothetical protein
LARPSAYPSNWPRSPALSPRLASGGRCAAKSSMVGGWNSMTGSSVGTGNSACWTDGLHPLPAVTAPEFAFRPGRRGRTTAATTPSARTRMVASTPSLASARKPKRTVAARIAGRVVSRDTPL